MTLHGEKNFYAFLVFYVFLVVINVEEGILRQRNTKIIVNLNTDQGLPVLFNLKRLLFTDMNSFYCINALIHSAIHSFNSLEKVGQVICQVVKISN